MAGLLDFISTPEGQGLLSAAFGGLAGARRGQPLNSIGRAGLAGLSGYVDATDRVTQQDQLAKMNQMRDLQLKQAQQQMADAEARKLLAQQSAMSPGAMAVSQNGGPTLAAANAMPTTAPGFDFKRYASGLAGLGDVQGSIAIQEAIKKQAPKLLSVAPGNVVIDEATGETKFTAPNKPAEQPSAVREYEYAKQQGYGGTFEQFQLAQRRAGASSVTVGTGKVGELETSYRKEFNALPEVTRYKSALPAFKAVQGAATRPGTQSEINLIYGLAKLYDPESVVREGEYDTIANSQSIPEWLKGQAQRLAGGGKLTPETKSQILIEAKARKQTLEDEYTGAQRTYDGIARRQGLDPQNIFTPVGGYAAPEANKPKSRLVTLDSGGSATATLGADDNYYIKRGGKTYRVED